MTTLRCSQEFSGSSEKNLGGRAAYAAVKQNTTTRVNDRTNTECAFRLPLWKSGHGFSRAAPGGAGPSRPLTHVRGFGRPRPLMAAVTHLAGDRNKLPGAGAEFREQIADHGDRIRTCIDHAAPHGPARHPPVSRRALLTQARAARPPDVPLLRQLRRRASAPP